MSRRRSPPPRQVSQFVWAAPGRQRHGESRMPVDPARRSGCECLESCNGHAPVVPGHCDPGPSQSRRHVLAVEDHGRARTQQGPAAQAAYEAQVIGVVHADDENVMHIGQGDVLSSDGAPDRELRRRQGRAKAEDHERQDACE